MAGDGLAPARLHAPRLGRTQGSPSKGPVGPRGSVGGQLASPPPREFFPHQGWDPLHERGSGRYQTFPGWTVASTAPGASPGKGRKQNGDV
jgi:hypothetical protein